MRFALCRLGTFEKSRESFASRSRKGKPNQQRVSSLVHSCIIDLVESLLQKPHNVFLFYRASIIDRVDGKCSTGHTQRFTRAKRRALGEVGTERKVFHSLRHEFAQQLDRNQVPEDRIALLMGHKRGKTEAFKTYSKHAASPKELSCYVEMVRYGFT